MSLVWGELLTCTECGMDTRGEREGGISTRQASQRACRIKVAVRRGRVLMELREKLIGGPFLQMMPASPLLRYAHGLLGWPELRDLTALVGLVGWRLWAWA